MDYVKPVDVPTAMADTAHRKLDLPLVGGALFTGLARDITHKPRETGKPARLLVPDQFAAE